MGGRAVMRARMWWARCRSGVGLAGVCGVLAALAGAWVHGVLVQQRQTELAEVQAQARAVSASAPARRDTTAGQSPEAFEALFPRADTLPDWLERIESASTSSGVVVQRTEYRVAAEAAAGLARYQIALPVKGSYSQVRGFVAALLEAVPTLAVTDIDVKREAIGSATVEARINVAVYLRGAHR
jgi:Tfp pilus assembly protein PilO